MATITDVFSHIYTTEAYLTNVPVKNGQIILCVDSEKLYIDKGTVRISTSDIVKVSNYDALPIAPLDKLYITEDGKLYLYINNAWKELSTDLDTSRLLPANPEEKTILGYENGSWTGIPSGTFVQSINGTYTSNGAITIPNASTTDAGLMSAEDKVKLNNLGDGYLTSITTGQGLSGAGTVASPLTLNLSNYSTNSTIKMVSAAGAVNLISNTGEAGLYSGSNVYVKALTDTVELKATTVSLNGHAQNTSGGFVVVDSSTGKIPESLLPEIGNASWTKVTLNQADFATEDTTYGGSYKELDGVCSVEVYDAGGYKVEFDVKCDFTGMKTRIYIPSGLSASTISNWTLLYLAKTIA